MQVDLREDREELAGVLASQPVVHYFGASGGIVTGMSPSLGLLRVSMIPASMS